MSDHTGISLRLRRPVAIDGSLEEQWSKPWLVMRSGPRHHCAILAVSVGHPTSHFLDDKLYENDQDQHKGCSCGMAHYHLSQSFDVRRRGQQEATDRNTSRHGSFKATRQELLTLW